MAHQSLGFVGVRAQKHGQGTIGSLTVSGATPGNLLLFVHSHTNSFGEYVPPPTGWDFGVGANDSAVRINVHSKEAEGNANDNINLTEDGGSFLVSVFEFSGVDYSDLGNASEANTDTVGPSFVSVSSSASSIEGIGVIAVGTRHRWGEAGKDFVCNYGTKVFSTYDGNGLAISGRPGHFINIGETNDGTIPWTRWDVAESTVTIRNWLACARLCFRLKGSGAPVLSNLIKTAGVPPNVSSVIDVDY